MWLMLTIGLDGTDLLHHSRVLLLGQLLSPLLRWVSLMQDSMSVLTTSIPHISQAVQLLLKLLQLLVSIDFVPNFVLSNMI